MADLSTTFMGVRLKNPIILGACSIVEDLGAIKKLERAGLAAIVYRSLFEEQINLEHIQLDEQLGEYSYRNAEMGNIFPEIKHSGAAEHLHNLEKLIKTVNIPVFASLNAINDSS
ncbi:MAG: hypothetical protein LWW85_15570 [Marinilabiliales bacterium]|nr:hypothetical protein [Marinilabiliales bacterium]